MAYTTDFTGMDFSKDKRFQPYKVDTSFTTPKNPNSAKNSTYYQRTSTLIKAINKANKAEIARLKYKQMYKMEPPKYMYDPTYKEDVDRMLKEWKPNTK